MRNILVKATAVVGICVLSLSMSGCSGKSGIHTKAGNGKSSSSSKSGHSKSSDASGGDSDMRKFTIPEVIERFKGKTFGGDKLENTNPSSQVFGEGADTVLKIFQGLKVEPSECSLLVGGAATGLDYSEEVKKMAYFRNSAPSAQVSAVAYNTNPDEKLVENLKSAVELGDKCKDANVIGQKISMVVVDMPEYNSVADIAYYVETTLPGLPPGWVYEIFLKNGQALSVTAQNQHAGKQAVDDALKYLEINK